jgi:hypothetical protein
MLAHAALIALCARIACGASLDHALWMRHFQEAHLQPAPKTAAVAPSTYPTGVVVMDTQGVVTDSTNAWDWYSMVTPEWASASYISYALWGAGNYAAYTWSCACYGTQGAYIFEKILAFGRPSDRYNALTALLAAPQQSDGKIWEAANTEWHVGHQGSWEAPAEFVIMAKMYAAYSGDKAAFTTAPERLVCAQASGSSQWTLAGVPQPGLPADACTTSPSTLLEGTGNGYTLFRDVVSMPLESGGLMNSGRILTETLNISVSFDALSVAVTFNARARSLWPANVTVYSVATSARVGFVNIDSASLLSSWTTVPMDATTPPGTYLIVLTAADTAPGMSADSSWWLGASWVSNAYPEERGGGNQATYGNTSVWMHTSGTPRANAIDAGQAIDNELTRVAARIAGNLPVGKSVADSVTAATAFNLRLMSMTQPNNALGVYVIPDSRFRGSMEDDVNSGCSYYDLLRIGFASSYINLRVLEALDAYAELQAGGFIPSTCDGSDTCFNASYIQNAAKSLRFSIGNTFSDATTGAWVDWFGCHCLAQAGFPIQQCGVQNVSNGAIPSNNTCLNVAKSAFVPTYALAAKLQVPAGGTNLTATMSAYERIRAESVVTPGYFRTNVIGLETISSKILIANLGWSLFDANGYPIKSYNQTGDWHTFAPVGSDGYGNWGLQGENGGRFFTTSAMVWEASPGGYATMLTEWRRMVTALEGIGVQLAAGNYGTPLLSNDTSFLSSPSTDTIVQYLCVKVRQEAGFPNKTDAWKAILCDYYQDLGFGTPENGVALFSFVKGLLQLNVLADGSLLVGGVAAPQCPTGGAFTLSPYNMQDVASISVFGLSVGAYAGVNVTCTATSSTVGGGGAGADCNVACPTISVVKER